ncbi:hypothetical protein [Xanthomonas axonopodis]|uniref:Uncharacterized protein n=1 Tax=Xanthomonas axonopodis pv. vasculorum TaxID=325777 RepID=A0A098Q0N9_9XANT|nr:hypothetical protein [Xanthomonas axonopodis]KGE52964.1 hypothetical protein GW15_0205625 [Xanthomonas axonopodis pv. vasculorum]PPV04658.1 hypothetical protein XavaCFBP5823_21535 [Xanthomonas axonopodis pv. vasculorum]QKD85441.1 hypothetical protein XAV_01955 [Xanthomonas axonopodis pv. vasculorum]
MAKHLLLVLVLVLVLVRRQLARRHQMYFLDLLALLMLSERPQIQRQLMDFGSKMVVINGDWNL